MSTAMILVSLTQFCRLVLLDLVAENAASPATRLVVEQRFDEREICGIAL